MEKVNHRATKIFIELSELSYQDRLKASVLITLQTRHDRADLIGTFKTPNNLEDVDPDSFKRSDVNLDKE